MTPQEALKMLSSRQAPVFAKLGGTKSIRINANDDEDDYAEVDLSESKTCNKCKGIKNITLFSRNNAAFDGRCNICKDCQKAKAAVYYEINREEIKERIAKSRQKNWGAYIASQKKWQKENPEKYRATVKRNNDKRAAKKLTEKQQGGIA